MARVAVSNRPSVMEYFNFVGTTARVEVTSNLSTLTTPGDLDLQVLYQKNGASDTGVLIARLSGSGQPATYGFYFAVNASNVLNYRWSTTGVGGGLVSKVSSANVAPISTTTPVWLRVTHDVDNGASGNDVRFYWGAYKGNRTPPTTWTQIGATQTTAGTTSIFATPTVGVTVGSYWSGALGLLTGKVYRALVKDGIDGTTLVDMDATGIGFFTSTIFIEPAAFRTGQFTGSVTLNKTRSAVSGRVSGV